MRTIKIFAVLGFFLLSSAVIGAETGDPLSSENQQPIDLETPTIDGDAKTDEPTANAESPEDISFGELVPMMRPIPTPIPNYCPSCQPCQVQANCGRDPHNGAPLGICSAPPNSWCPGTTVSVCICY